MPIQKTMARISTVGAVVIAVVIGGGTNAKLRAQARLAPATFPFDIVPGRRFGPITENTSRSALTSVARANAIRESSIEIGEGFCTSGVRLFPDTDDEVEVAWQDAAQTRVAFVRTRRPGGRWHTARGVRIGTLLTDLERLANRVLTFSGFGWDYGGGMAWAEESGEIGLRLDIERTETSTATGRDDEIYGDHIVRSDHPVIRTRRVRVDEIIQTWGQHATETDCR